MNEQGGGAGLSRNQLDTLLFQLFSTAGSLDTCLCDFVPHKR